MQQHVPSEQSAQASLPKERGAPAASGGSLLLQRQEDAAVADSPRQVAQQQAQERLHSGPRQTAQRRRLETLQRASPQAGAGKPSPPAGGLPDNLKNGIESLSGISMDAVRVHYNSTKPAQLSAHAYAQGSDIHLGPGQERHLPHEAWHVVQQKQGRVKPTLQMKDKININDDEGLEKEADRIGARALQRSAMPESNPLSQTHSGMGQERKFSDENRKSQVDDSNSVGLPGVGQLNTAAMQAATPPIQRVELPIAETTGTKYDASKHTARKTKARELFEKLPGPTENSDDFTWHHIVPQSHLPKVMADNPMMIRLGPSSSYRIDDPGNDYTDPNYLPDGTHTPFSEAVEAGLREPPRLDHAVLAEKLKALLAKHSDIKDKAIADPVQWHIAIKQLAAAEGLTHGEINTLWNLAKPTTYFVKGEKREDEAIAWSELEQSKLARYEGLFAKLDEHIKVNPKVFFRGFQQDEAATKMFRITRHLRKSAECELDLAINRDAALRTAILSSGKVLVFVHRSGKLGAKVSKAIEQLVKSQGLGSWRGKAHRYYSGSGEVHVDNVALGKANATRQNLAESGVGEDKPERLVTHTITGHDDASEDMMSRVSTTADNAEISDVADEDVPKAWLVKEGKSNGPVAREYIVINAEEERIVTSGHIAKKYKAEDRKRSPKVSEIEKSQKVIKERGKDLGAFNGKLLDDYRRSTHEKRVNAAKLIKFRGVQQSRIEDVNSSTARYSGYADDTGAAEAQKEASSLTNTEFLKSYWPDWEAHITQFKKRLGTVVLASPAVIKGKELDFVASAEEFTKQTHTLIAEAVETITKDLRKSITSVSSGLDSSTVNQRAALIKPTAVAPDMLAQAPGDGVRSATRDAPPPPSKSASSKKERSTASVSGTASEEEPGVAGSGARSELLVDADGGILPGARDLFIDAYRTDTRTHNTFLTEGEGAAIADHLHIALQVFRGTTPPGWVRIENDGGGNCLIHSIYQASRAGEGLPEQASGEEIAQARALPMPDESIIALCGAAIGAELEGVGEQGLGPRIRALIARACVDKYLAQPIVNKKAPVDTEKEAPAVSPAIVLDMPQIGTGVRRDNVALLHTGGDHWVLLRRAVMPM